MAATVVNVRTEAFDVYIGRACPRARDRRCHEASPWMNFLRPGRDGTSGECLKGYEGWLRAWLLRPGEKERLLELDGKRLGCWCAPAACHGDVLVKVIEELKAAGASVQRTGGLFGEGAHR